MSSNEFFRKYPRMKLRISVLSCDAIGNLHKPILPIYTNNFMRQERLSLYEFAPLVVSYDITLVMSCHTIYSGASRLLNLQP